MAETIKINMNFSLEQKMSLDIPEEIRAPIGSIIQWNILGFNKQIDDRSFFWRNGLIFTLYFSDDSPFRWKRQFIQLHGEPYYFPYYPSKIIRFAEDVADEKGDFKYGIKITDGQSDETLFDEDPRLIIF